MSTILSDKSFDEVMMDLEAVIQRLGFAILKRTEASAILPRDDDSIDENSAAFDIANYRLNSRLLAANPAAQLLPQRIVVFTRNGETWLSYLPPFALNPLLPQPLPAPLLNELSERLQQILEESR